MAVDVFGDDVEVAADRAWVCLLQPERHACVEAVHPGELVGELVGADGIAVGQIDVDDAHAADHDLEDSARGCPLRRREAWC